jgi:hypothetical protein
MAHEQWRPVKDVSYTPPSASVINLTGILSLNIQEDEGVSVETTDGFAHQNNAIEGARSSSVTLRGRDLAQLEAIRDAAKGGVLKWTEIGLNGATDREKQAEEAWCSGLSRNANVPDAFEAEITFQLVTEEDRAIVDQST